MTGREAALAWASLAQRFPASSVLARAGAGCGSVGDVPGAWLASSLRSPAQVEKNQAFPPQPQKDLESPSSTRLEALVPSRDSRARTRSPSPRAWTGISGLHSRLPRGVRPRLEGKPRTPLSSRVATRVLSCVWNLRVSPHDAQGCQCPFVLCLHPQGCLRRGVRASGPSQGRTGTRGRSAKGDENSQVGSHMSP